VYKVTKGTKQQTQKENIMHKATKENWKSFLTDEEVNRLFWNDVDSFDSLMELRERLRNCLGGTVDNEAYDIFNKLGHPLTVKQENVTVGMQKKKYHGCNQKIKEALQDGYNIECKVRNFPDQESFVKMVTYFEEGQYRTIEDGGSWWNYAEPNFKEQDDR
jgi:hypothetical protein